MFVDSERLGPIEVADASVIELPAGLLGFETCHRFALIPADDVGAYVWLQSIDDPTLAFLAVVPGFFFPDYAPELPDEDAAALELESDADAQVLALVTISDDAVTANLMGPVVLNVSTRQARQVVLTDPPWPTRAPLVSR
jgi:flagellar assembly factor FliW